jgi:hypothetical protein
VRERILLVGVAAMLGAGTCGGSSDANNPCLAFCHKANSCRSANATPIPCDAACNYGGTLWPGLAPTPACDPSVVAAQARCVNDAVVPASCDTFETALRQCPACPVLDGSPCAADIDCAKYQPSYRCDLSRPGGYCTAPCASADDCSAVGPESCASARSPSFDPQAPATQRWCMLGCMTDASCRTAEGYSCVGITPASAFGSCDAP